MKAIKEIMCFSSKPHTDYFLSNVENESFFPQKGEGIFVSCLTLFANTASQNKTSIPT